MDGGSDTNMRNSPKSRPLNVFTALFERGSFESIHASHERARERSALLPHPAKVGPTFMRRYPGRGDLTKHTAEPPGNYTAHQPGNGEPSRTHSVLYNPMVVSHGLAKTTRQPKANAKTKVTETQIH
jgi:hypothetical protein